MKLTTREQEMVNNLFTIEEQRKLLDEMDRLWHGIGPDAEQSVGFSGCRMTNEIAAEFVLDASRLEMEAEQNKDALLDALLKKFRTLAYPVQEKFLLTEFNYY